MAAALRPVRPVRESELGLWRDVFVRQGMPWGRFVQSVILHSGALALIWIVSLSWLRQQQIVATPEFDHSEVITYTPEEYLPPLDTGVTDPAPPAKGDPVFAKQPILSVPKEADNRRQTIVAPPDVRLNHDVPLPNMIAMSTPAPVVPIDATKAPLRRLATPDTQIVAPAPQLDSAQNRVVRSALTTSIIDPPPEVKTTRTRGMSGPDTSVVEPPPDVARSTMGRVGAVNIGPSQVVAPAPQLNIPAQHTVSGRGTGGLPGGGIQAVAPPPSMGGGGAAGSSGRLIALGIHPVAPSGPVATPGGNRRGAFAANPSGKAGAAGTPGSANGSSTGASGNGTNGSTAGLRGRENGSLPSGLHVGAADSASGVASNGNAREMASATPPRVGGKAAPVSEDKATDVDRQVFGAKRFYSMTSNTPNLNSSTGSWVIRFAELKANQRPGELSAPDAIQKSDPGYPIELMRANVQGTVTLYAIIHSDGTVGEIRVLTSPDDRLDALAKSALARWKFRPATKDGQPVALEAVVVIPFRAKRTNF
ncbi:MAG: TonB family protein [Acidobacteria bacterium]|nr:TonB family protein [Acidobacteriota bacterium]